MDYGTTHRARLLGHAREYAAALQDEELISGVILGGSVAHGGVDRESDLDLVVVVAELPAAEQRAAWLARLMGREVDPAKLPRTDERKWDAFHVPGPKVDPEQWGPGGAGGGLFYLTEAEGEAGLGRVGQILTAGLDEGESSLLGACLEDVAHGIILVDRHGRCARWQQQLARYPESARVRLINYHWRQAEIALNEDLQRALWRGDWLHAHDRRVEGVRQLVRMLFAMNRRYFRKAKGLDRLLPTFEACPPHAWERLVAALGEPDHQRAAAMVLAFAGEVIDLIEPPDLLERHDHWRELCRRWAQEFGLIEAEAG